MFKILAIDGGIMLGVIPAQVLTRLEEDYKDQLGGKRLVDCFDLVAGTSTGGLIAAGLTSKTPDGNTRSAQDIRQLYFDRGEDIFPSKSWLGSLVSKLPVRRTMYKADGINKVLRQTFDNTRLSQTKPYLLVPSYESVRRAAFFFSSKDLDPGQDHETEPDDWLLRDVCRATSAGPPFLPAHFIHEPERKRYYCFGDGGTFANNPAMCAYAEAIKKFGQTREKIMILSLGTSTPNKRDATNVPGDGRMTEQELKKAYDKIPRRAFALVHIKTIIQMLLDGNADTVTFQAEQHMDERFLRVQPYDCDNRTKDAFSTDEKTLRSWCDLADDAVNAQAAKLGRFMDCLINDKDPADHG